MIYDRLENIARYRFEDKNMEVARTFLLEHDVLTLEPRRYDIQGEDVFMVYHEVEQIPMEGAKYEAHDRYVDIHITVEGNNFIRTTEKKNLTETTVYDEANDFILGQYQGEYYTDSYIGKGFFGVYYPEDAHLVNAFPGERHLVKKFVLKVKVR